MPRLLAFLSLVVLVGLSIWLIFSPPKSEKAENDTEAVVIEQPELEEVPGLTEEQLPEAEEVGGLQRTEIEPLALGGVDPNVEYGEPVTEGIMVTVVDAEDGELLPKAEVMVLDMGLIDQSIFQMQMMQQPDFETVFSHFGVVYRTDETAKVMIPFPDGDLLLAGRTDTHFDFSMSVDSNDEEIELAIKRVALLRVHVVDDRGVAVEGAPVGLRMKQDMFKQDMMRNYTNEEGWTNLRLFQLLLDNLPADSTYVAIVGLFDKPIEKLVDLQDLPEEGVELVMPDSGSMTVTVVDQEGKPVEDYVGILLNIVDPDQAQAPGAQADLEMEQPDFVDTTQTGKLTIPRVGFGLDLSVKATTMNEILTGTVEIEGPTRSQPHVDVEVKIGMEAAVVKGRLVNAEGKPGPNITLRSRLEEKHGSGSSSTSSSIRTDGEGYFQIKLDDPVLDAGATRTLTLIMKATRKKPERDVVVDLSRSFLPGVTDLGDVMVTAPPLAASGKVLKPDGSPLRDAEITMELYTTYGTGPDDFYWDNIHDNRARTDKDGHFILAGRFEPGRYRLRVTSSRYPNAYQPARIGEEGLEITMTAGGGLTGVLLLDKSIPRDEISLRLERQQDSASSAEVLGGFGLSVETSGKFQHRGLTPGTYSLVLNCDDSDEELFRQDNIIVNMSDEGEATDVGEIDLRGRLRTFRIKFRDEDDKVVRRVRVTVGDSDYSNYAWDGSWDVVTAEPSLDLSLAANGYRRVELKGIGEDTDVVFRPGIKVRLRVTNPSVIPPGYTITLNLRSTDPNSRSGYMFNSHEGLDGANEQLVYAMEAGDYVVEAQLSQNRGNQSTTWWGVSEPEGSAPIQVQDVGGEQFFDVEINAESIAGIVERIEKSE